MVNFNVEVSEIETYLHGAHVVHASNNPKPVAVLAASVFNKDAVRAWRHTNDEKAIWIGPAGGHQRRHPEEIGSIRRTHVVDSGNLSDVDCSGYELFLARAGANHWLAIPCPQNHPAVHSACSWIQVKRMCNAFDKAWRKAFAGRA